MYDTLPSEVPRFETRTDRDHHGEDVAETWAGWLYLLIGKAMEDASEANSHARNSRTVPSVPSVFHTQDRGPYGGSRRHERERERALGNLR